MNALLNSLLHLEAPFKPIGRCPDYFIQDYKRTDFSVRRKMF
jgi:hypothetical protein